MRRGLDANLSFFYTVLFFFYNFLLGIFMYDKKSVSFADESFCLTVCVAASIFSTNSIPFMHLYMAQRLTVLCSSNFFCKFLIFFHTVLVLYSCAWWFGSSSGCSSCSPPDQTPNPSTQIRPRPPKRLLLSDGLMDAPLLL